ncbi:MAG TPA: hypothetical protein QF353_05300, partial [Gammaproteobacteria bacterium]|nr:hypothetical protein [Gammaproteobacteria bacterium]
MIYNNILTKTTDNVSRFYNDNEQGEPVSVYIKLLYISLYGLILYYTANPLMTEFSEALAYLSDIEIVVTAISFSSVVAYSLMLLDRMVEIINPKRSSVNNGHTNSSSNNQNMLHLFNIASVIVLCMKFNIIQLALNNFMNILGLFILVPYIIDIHSLFKALNSDKKLFSNIFNKHSLSFNMTSLKQAYIYTLISISMFLDSIVNKFLLFIHIIAETAFAVAGQSKGNTGSSRRSNINMSAIIGIIAEYVID